MIIIQNQVKESEFQGNMGMLFMGGSEHIQHVRSHRVLTY